MTLQDFINRARAKHGDKYDYSKVVFKDRDTKVCIICPDHGEFWQNPRNHWMGQNCPICAKENRRLTPQEFLDRARAIHGSKYDYSKANYIDGKTKVCIICPKHGEYWQRPDGHLRGCICPQCVLDEKRNTLEYYIERSKKKHGDKYDFSHAIYAGCDQEIEIHCKECSSIFYSTPLALIKGRGCRMCQVDAHRRIECLDGEEWRDIEGFDGYQVSNMGRVKSLDRIVQCGSSTRRIPGLILKIRKDKDGYDTVGFKKGKYGKSYLLKVHRLVAKAFIPNPNNYECIDHINGVRDDNRVENLRWCTVKMNANYELAKQNRSEAIRQSYIKNPDLRQVRAQTLGKSNSIRVEVFENDISLGIFDSINEAASMLGIYQSTLYAIYTNRIKSKVGITVKKI